MPVRVPRTREYAHGRDLKGPPTLLDHNGVLGDKGNDVAWESAVFILDRAKDIDLWRLVREQARARRFLRQVAQRPRASVPTGQYSGQPLDAFGITQFRERDGGAAAWWSDVFAQPAAESDRQDTRMLRCVGRAAFVAIDLACAIEDPHQLLGRRVEDNQVAVGRRFVNDGDRFAGRPRTRGRSSPHGASHSARWLSAAPCAVAVECGHQS